MHQRPRMPMINSNHVRHCLHGLLCAVAVTMLLLLPLSWVLSIYFDGVHALLDPRGIRWMCSHIVSNFSAVPLAQILLAAMTLGVLRHSGIVQAFRSTATLKQKRALQITVVSAVLLLALFSLLLFLPDAILLSAFGTIAHSPLSRGLYGLMACFFLFVGSMYGYTSGRFATLRHFVHAHAAFFPALGECVLLLFLSGQLIGSLDYTGMLSMSGTGAWVLQTLKIALFYIPPLLYAVIED